MVKRFSCTNSGLSGGRNADDRADRVREQTGTRSALRRAHRFLLFLRSFYFALSVLVSNKTQYIFSCRNKKRDTDDRRRQNGPNEQCSEGLLNEADYIESLN